MSARSRSSTGSIICQTTMTESIIICTRFCFAKLSHIYPGPRQKRRYQSMVSPGAKRYESDFTDVQMPPCLDYYMSYVVTHWEFDNTIDGYMASYTRRSIIKYNYNLGCCLNLYFKCDRLYLSNYGMSKFELVSEGCAKEAYFSILVSGDRMQLELSSP